VPLVFPSTTSVYGMQAETVDEECDSLRPQSPYAESKLHAEKLLEHLGAVEDLRFVSLRLGTIFGTSPGMRFHTAVNKFCRQAANAQPLTVWRDALHQHRPYLDLGDATRALAFVLRREMFDRRLYNVLTLNATAAEITSAISAWVPGVRVELVDSPLLNQHSYHVSRERFTRTGFEFNGDLGRGIGETLRFLGAIARHGEAATAGAQS
jgi:nucleoside-diphosphate-sugar epimerase